MAKRILRPRDLTKAVTLRPRDVFDLYGIQPAMVSYMCNHEDPAKRLPSTLVPGRKGHRGMRLIDHGEFRTWLARWKEPLLASSVASPAQNAA